MTTQKFVAEAERRRARSPCGLGELSDRGAALGPRRPRHRPYGHALAFAPPALLARSIRHALRRLRP
jgi:hypothetical protein